MLTPTLLIFESRPRWVPELERQFIGQNVRVRGCGSLSILEERLMQTANNVVILEWEAAPANGLETLAGLMTRIPSPTILVTATAAYRELEWPVRELGAVAFLEEPISGEEMAAYCRRQFHPCNAKP